MLQLLTFSTPSSFDLQQSSGRGHHVYVVVQPVELQVDGVQSSLAEAFQELESLANITAVGGYLDLGEAHLLRLFYHITNCG
jgi:hypothetical protein